jgi:hypothetical protein
MGCCRYGVAVIMGGLFALLGLFGIDGSWGAYARDTAVLQHGARTVGHVAGLDRLSSADGDSDFMVDYWFELRSGERIAAQRGVSTQLWTRLRVGDAVEIAYSPANPRQNFPLGAGVTSLGLVLCLTVICAVFATFGALVFVSALRTARQLPLCPPAN